MTLAMALKSALEIVREDRRPVYLLGSSCRYQLFPEGPGDYAIRSSLRYDGSWTSWSDVDRIHAFGIDDVLCEKWIVAT